ncbi:MAG: RimK family alpha-L-glutamate ligase [Bdellovibrionales bacterium]|nr:RimK family alpha-L-glutamate ligase [Bdellovibrionales bacterium]
MHIWIVSHLEASATSRLLIDAARRRGHQAVVVHPFKHHILFAQERQFIIGDQSPAELPDGVITRLGSSAPAAALHFIRHLEQQGLTCLNSSASLEKTRNKIRSFYELSRQAVPIPRTAFVSSKSPLPMLLEQMAGPPWIAKLPVGTQGKGVVLVESEASLSSLVDAVEALSGRVMVQEYIAESVGTDLRVLVLGGKAIAAMRRRAPAGDFRANLHRGGSPEPVPLNPELVDVAEQAAAALGLAIAGVDLMEAKNGYLVIEVNGSPGLEGLQSVNETDVGDAVIACLEDFVRARAER